MAKAPDKQETPPVEAAPKKKKLLLLIIVGLVLVLAVGGGAAFVILKNRNLDPDAEHVEKKVEVIPTFVKLDPFTVKLQPEEGKQEQYMQTTPELKVLNAHVAEKAKSYMPEIRHNVLLLLSSKKPSELSSPQGMEGLSMEMRSQINRILGGEESTSGNAKVGPDDPVQAVMFSSFIIQ